MPVAATTSDADKTTVRSRELRLAVTKGSEARRREPVVFFIFHLHLSNNERCGNNELCGNNDSSSAFLERFPTRLASLCCHRLAGHDTTKVSLIENTLKHALSKKACVIHEVEATLVTTGSSKLSWSRPAGVVLRTVPPRRRLFTHGDDAYQAQVHSGRTIRQASHHHLAALSERWRNLPAQSTRGYFRPLTRTMRHRATPPSPQAGGGMEKHPPDFAAIGLIALRCGQGVKKVIRVSRCSP